MKGVFGRIGRPRVVCLGWKRRSRRLRSFGGGLLGRARRRCREGLGELVFWEGKSLKMALKWAKKLKNGPNMGFFTSRNIGPVIHAIL